MAQVPTGTTFYIGSAYGAAKNTTVVTNASEAVVTSASHGYSNGDVVEVTSGWGRLNLRSFRIKSVTTDTFVLEGADTSSTTFFPSGSGIGSVRKVSTFTQIQQVLGIDSSGGDPKNVNYKYFESDVEYSINDGFAAQNMTLQLDADSISTAGYTALKSLTDVQTNTCLKISSRNGAVIYMPCTVALNEAVQMQDGQINRVAAAFNGIGRLVRYAS
jgi:NADPH-dependent curcumin reductase CurA